ncbi:hypothetical protein NHH03_23810 [Stieleria sp. TO1_6]|uniref:tetratricopeptide repeat protein n=1 Tax=Stieleria tagensis TaxID=2956795 RepID=UPI00209A7C19|nr:tetratricopeptide repeat protein [Stieleria tagensis]MCO8124784.1 hypothetical protein [Stieleria tagensis]
MLLSVLMMGPGWSQSNGHAGGSTDDVPAAIRQIHLDRDSGDLAGARKRLLELQQQSEVDLSVEFVLLARKAVGHLEATQIDALYIAAADSLTHTDCTAGNCEQRLLIRTVVATHLVQAGQSQVAVPVLVAAMDELQRTQVAGGDKRQQSLVNVAMQTARLELNAPRPESAETLYQSILQFAETHSGRQAVADNRAMAMLGLGWATAMQPERQRDAAERLQQFADAFPTHQDAPQTLAMRIHCLRQLDQWDESDSATDDFLSRWPAHELTESLVLETLARRLDPGPWSPTPAVADWISAQGDTQRWSIDLVAAVLSVAGEALPADRFDVLVERLATEDSNGQRTAGVLSELSHNEGAAVAEQVAARLIACDLPAASEMACESACRWAGRTGRWSMLALAAGTIELDQPIAARTVHVDRLFAEALTQTSQGKQAFTWWAHLVDQRGATDFATLLRCAETAVSHAEVTEAGRRLDRVRRCVDELATEKMDIKTALVDLLDADLAIRRLDFPRARSLFEKVVQSPQSTAGLRGRAQWMIGETHFMQHHFAEAIDAYRQVEGMDPGGPYAAPSLVQAGKSFEQLGRTQEAGVCYGTLLNRFADSAHAAEARRRMASLPGTRQKSPGRAGKNADAFDSDSSRLRR